MRNFQLLNFIITGLMINCLTFGQAVTPQELGGKFNFQVGNTYFEVDPSFGARISSFKIDDQEMLFQSRFAGDYLWGSTLWQSPQSEWNWPPSVALDQAAYTGGIIGDSVVLRSGVDETYSHLVFKKIFTADLSDTSLTIEYTMINNGSSAHSYSAWEVARVPSGGISFFPMGEETITGAFAGQTELINQVVWYEQDNSDPAGQKFMCDGAEGWSAHLNENSKLFVKKFDNEPAINAAPTEKEIELYYAGPSDYIELENQSAYKNIAAGDSVSWIMKWYLRNLPVGIAAENGNPNIVKYVRNMFDIAGPTGTDNMIAAKIRLYPNPVSEYLIITNIPSANANLIISDISGKVLLNTEIENNEQVQLTGFNSGLYFYQLTGFNIKQSGKLIIRK
jgi:hypothetical protein